MNDMKKEFILFDLDGTLTDSQLGITKSIQHALRYFDIEVEDLSQLNPFLGPPLKDSFQKYYGFSEEKALLATEKYREYYRDKGIFENAPYDGIKECLAAIKDRQVRIILATSKPVVFAERILEHFDLIQYFDSVVGATLDGRISEKTDVMKEAIKVNSIKELNKAVMIGDRKFDINSSNELGLDSIGVLYGYGSREELVHSKPTKIVGTVEELREVIIKMMES